MKLSVIINTAALGEKSADVESSGGVRHGFREYLLNTFILPDLIADPHVDEIIVSGEWREAPNGEWIYVECPSEFFGCEDALLQRAAGFEAASGDMLVFQHDDHIFAPGFARLIKTKYGSEDVISPSRWTRMRDPTGERLNSGWKDGYMHGHACVLSRDAAKDVRWKDVPKQFVWDTRHTNMLKKAGYEIALATDLKIFDIEHGSEPWR